MLQIPSHKNEGGRVSASPASLKSLVFQASSRIRDRSGERLLRSDSSRTDRTGRTRTGTRSLRERSAEPAERSMCGGTSWSLFYTLHGPKSTHFVRPVHFFESIFLRQACEKLSRCGCPLRRLRDRGALPLLLPLPARLPLYVSSCSSSPLQYTASRSQSRHASGMPGRYVIDRDRTSGSRAGRTGVLRRRMLACAGVRPPLR